MESLYPIYLHNNKNEEDTHHWKKYHGVKGEIIYAGKNRQKKPKEKDAQVNEMDSNLKKADQ